MAFLNLLRSTKQTNNRAPQRLPNIKAQSHLFIRKLNYLQACDDQYSARADLFNDTALVCAQMTHTHRYNFTIHIN